MNDPTAVQGLRPPPGLPPGEAQRSVDPARRAQTLGQLGRLPIHAEPLLRMLQAPADDPAAVTAALERCPNLSARVLSVTNSAAFGLRQPIDSVRRAVIHLGPTRARAIALAFGLRLLADSAGLPAAVTQCLWVASLRKAAAARLAAHVLAPEDAEHAYCLALIQDIGLPLLMAVDPNFYRDELQADRHREAWCACEVERFGIDHADVGCELLERWNAPGALRDAVRYHHRPPLEDPQIGVLVRLAAFAASLLPHLDEEPARLEREWLIALHAQFLAGQYPSPDAFIEDANRQAARLHGAEGPGTAATLEPGDVQNLIHAVTLDTESMVNQLCDLEETLGRQREHVSTLRFEAFTDPLTRVLNRRGFTRLCERRLAEAHERRQPVCAMLVDLDDFKPVNDRLGHEAGDLVLKAVARLLRNNLDRPDLVGRLGGDEFAVLITGVDESRARKIAQRLTGACLDHRVPVNERSAEVTVRISLGSVFAEAGDKPVSIDQLLAAADDAMYERKKNGKAGLVFTVLRP